MPHIVVMSTFSQGTAHRAAHGPVLGRCVHRMQRSGQLPSKHHIPPQPCHRPTPHPTPSLPPAPPLPPARLDQSNQIFVTRNDADKTAVSSGDSYIPGEEFHVSIISVESPEYYTPAGSAQFRASNGARQVLISLILPTCHTALFPRYHRDFVC